MIEPLVSLCFSLSSKKGIYALLLGSGISRSSGIKTGWEIVLDLICKVANLNGENCEDDPVSWYRDRFKEEPDYSKIINMVAKSSADRNQLLKGYFEPTPEEQDEGLKLPSKAHMAIANLVSKGFIRVIVTTNFDRLLEKALETYGLVPTVISTPDAIEGSLPISHTDCTVIKVNGDYLDTRIKNTDEELQKYDERLSSLLDRIFDEYGLIICGWSAEWDIALIEIIERCKNHRFTTYWTSVRELDGNAKKLATLRRAEVIIIKDADYFFQNIEEKIIALEEYKITHPVTVKSAISILKRYLTEDRYTIKLHDFIMGETEKAYDFLNEENFPIYSSTEEFPKRLNRYEAFMEILLMLYIYGIYFGNEHSNILFKKSLERIASINEVKNGSNLWLELRYYPVLLLIYASGISSVAKQDYQSLKTILVDSIVSNKYDDSNIIIRVNPASIFYNIGIGNKLPGFEKHRTPVSCYLFSYFREIFRELIPNDREFEKIFDRFEYLQCLIYADLFEKEKGRIWAWIGSFGWRNRDSDNYEINKLINESSEMEGDWPPIKAGLFGGSYERAKYVMDKYNNELLSRYSYL